MSTRRAVWGAAAFLALFMGSSLAGQTWHAVGPEGGDVRSLVADPRNPQVLYLGTSDGHLFLSRDGARSWRLLSRVGDRVDTVVMTLLVDRHDSRVLYAGTWTLAPGGGGVFRSEDGGRSWRPAGLEDHAVRALAQAPSHPEILLAGTVDGVYRSTNQGRSWSRISPPGHEDLRNFDSLAIDPQDPDLIYAGTYHLAWKTFDGGRNWVPIHKGMLDDSDVMNIEVDATNPQRIFATACSGIYRSENQGELWARVQGIPGSARRTHFIRQDPRRADTLYAGTTQGLWKSLDGSRTWKRLTPAAWSIIALAVHPESPERLVLGVERSGIYVSDDAGLSFRPSNQGFNHQQVMALAADPERPERMLVVLTNAAQPVLATRDGGRTWAVLGSGLKPESLRRIYATPATNSSGPTAWVATLERGGLMRYDQKKAAWVRAGVLLAASKAAAGKRGKQGATPRKAAPFALVLGDLGVSRTGWFAATPEGLFVSRDQGDNWAPAPVPTGKQPLHAVRVSKDGRRIAALSATVLVFSENGGQSWLRREHPFSRGGELRLYEAGAHTWLVTGRMGLYLTHDAGVTWSQAALPELAIADAAANEGVLLVSTAHQGLYFSADRGHTWSRVEGPITPSRYPFLFQGSAGFLIASSTEGLYALALPGLRAAADQQSAATGGSGENREK